MSKTLKKYGAAALTFVILIWLCISACVSPALAAGNGKIILSCRAHGESIEGMKWNIYKVGELDTQSSSVRFNAYAPFDRYYVYITDISANHLTDMASTLENMAVLDKVAPLASGTSDANGEVTFDGLEAGLYLLSGKYHKSADGLNSYRPAPSLVEITDAGGTLHIDAKITPLLTLDDEIKAHTVKKIWENDMGAIRPESVNVEIYQDGELVEVVELNEANNWTYRWTTGIDADWRVKEKDYFDKYTVVYRSSDVDDVSQYAIINTYDEDGDNVPPPPVTTTPAVTTTATTTRKSGPLEGDDVTRTSTASRKTVAGSNEGTSKTTATTATTASPNGTTTTDGPKLPQTGQLWWPIPLLIFGGSIFVVIGVRMRSKNKE